MSCPRVFVVYTFEHGNNALFCSVIYCIAVVAILAPHMLRSNVCMSIPVTGRLHKPVFIKMAKTFITQTTPHDGLGFHFSSAKDLGKIPTGSLPIAAPIWRREICNIRRIVCHIYVSKMVQDRRIHVVSTHVTCDALYCR